MKRPDPRARAQGGAALIEALVAMVIVAFGVLGFVGLQARTAVLNLEGYQRAQALILMNDMVQRINANRANAANYVLTSEYVGASTPPTSCPTTTRAAQDLCEWSKLLLGAAEKISGASVGAVTSARGCVQSLGGNAYVVAVFWEGVQPSTASGVSCGYSSTTYPTYTDTSLRRAVSTVVRIGTLT